MCRVRHARMNGLMEHLLRNLLAGRKENCFHISTARFECKSDGNVVGLSRQTREKLIAFDFRLAFFSVNQNSVDTTSTTKRLRPHFPVLVGLWLAIHQVHRLFLKHERQFVRTPLSPHSLEMLQHNFLNKINYGLGGAMEF